MKLMIIHSFNKHVLGPDCVTGIRREAHPGNKQAECPLPGLQPQKGGTRFAKF